MAAGRSGSTASLAASPHENLRYQFHANVLEASATTDTAQRTTAAVPVGHTARFGIMLMGQDGQSESLNDTSRSSDLNASTNKVKSMYIGKIGKADVERLSHAADGSLLSFDAKYDQTVGVRCWLYNYVREEVVAVSTLAVVNAADGQLMQTISHDGAVLPIRLAWFLQQQQRNGEMVTVTIDNVNHNNADDGDAHSPNPSRPHQDGDAAAPVTEEEAAQQEAENAKRLFFNKVSQRQASNNSNANNADDDDDEDNMAVADNQDGDAAQRKKKNKKALSLTHGNSDWRSNRLYLCGGAYAHWAPSEKAVHKVVLAERGLTDEFMLDRLAWTEGRSKGAKGGQRDANSPLRDAATRMLNSIYFPVVHRQSNSSPPSSARGGNTKSSRPSSKQVPRLPKAAGSSQRSTANVNNEPQEEAPRRVEDPELGGQDTEQVQPSSSQSETKPAATVKAAHSPQRNSATRKQPAPPLSGKAAASVKPYLAPLSPRGTARPASQHHSSSAESDKKVVDSPHPASNSATVRTDDGTADQAQQGDEQTETAQAESSTKQQQQPTTETSSPAKPTQHRPAKPALKPISGSRTNSSRSSSKKAPPPPKDGKADSAQVLDKLFV